MNNRPSLRSASGIPIATALATLFVFALDAVLLRGTAVGVLYAIPISISCRRVDKRLNIAVGWIVTALALTVGLRRATEVSSSETMVDLLIVLAVIAVTAVVAPKAMRRALQVREGQRKLATALREMHAMMSSMRCIVIRTDDKGVIRHWERTAERMFGLTSEEVCGRPLHDCGIPWVAQTGNEIRSFFDARQDELRAELAFLDSDEEKRFVGMTFTSFEANGGNYYTILGQDITERLATDAEHRLLITAVEQAGETIVITDRAGRIRYANPAFERVTGYTIKEATGMDPGFLKSGAHDRAFYDHMWATLNRGEVWSGRFANKRKDGTIFHEDATISPIQDGDGKTINYVAVKRDITERIRREVQLQAAQKLESIGQLAAGIAHEINTPTQYISDNTRFLKEAFRKLEPLLERCSKLDGADQEGAVDELIALADRAGIEFLTEEVPQAIDESLTGLQRVAEIVGAMRNYAHPGTDEKVPTQLNELLAHSITLCRNEWKYVADVECDFDESLPLVPCLPGEVGQVVINLLVNAAQAIDEKRNDDSERGVIEISTKLDGDDVELRVSDTGCGMPEEVRLRIFDPFFTTKDVGKGTGQGLAIVHAAICEKHGGTIEVESKPGEGTVFLIRLPLSERMEMSPR